jgi:plastocyanin
MRIALVLLVTTALLFTAFAAGCADTPPANGTSAPATPPATGGGAGQPVAIALTAQDMQFDTDILAAPAGAIVAVAFENRDAGVQHNLAVYTDTSARTPVFRGLAVTGPGSATYTFTAPSTPGTYHFRCDFHPDQMTGSFVVQ